MSHVLRRRLTVVGLLSTLLLVLAIATSSSWARASGTCYTEGIVFLESDHAWTTALPNSGPSGTCWTVERADNQSEFTQCNVQKLSQDPIGSGPSWFYNDTNNQRTGSSSDVSINSNYCHGKQAYYYEWMSHSGGTGYYWDFSPQYVIEEDYSGSTNQGYSGVRHQGSGARVNSAYASIPGLNAAGTSIGSYITADCHKVVTYSGTPTQYTIALWNGSDPGSNETAIYNALNSCYPG